MQSLTCGRRLPIILLRLVLMTEFLGPPPAAPPRSSCLRALLNHLGFLICSFYFHHKQRWLVAWTVCVCRWQAVIQQVAVGGHGARTYAGILWPLLRRGSPHSVVTSAWLSPVLGMHICLAKGRGMYDLPVSPVYWQGVAVSSDRMAEDLGEHSWLWEGTWHSAFQGTDSSWQDALICPLPWMVVTQV